MEKVYVLTENDIENIKLTMETTRLELITELKGTEEYVIEKIRAREIKKEAK